ncbi:MAG: shikimate dehydrogenase [Verrucomicrobiales bacterium]|nr:shikimate dehydrogenase [Verrucomicrobiales bacterium]
MPEFFHLDDLLHAPPPSPDGQPPARLAVIGDPVAHSKSPQMHNPALQAAGIPAQYIRVHVPPGRVREAFDTFRRHGFFGCNITIPHKLEAMQAVDDVAPLAARLGAVNTLVISDEGHFTGHNTDGPGFLRAVREAFQKEIIDLRVLILGAGGGAGRATAVQCALADCPRLVLVNRTAEKVERLSQELRELNGESDITALAWEDEILSEELANIDLIVNATSRGMKPGDAPLLPTGALRAGHQIFDMVYRPDASPTPLIEAAQNAHLPWTDGLNLLLHQGAISFEHWFSQPAPIDAMRRGLLATATA